MHNTHTHTHTHTTHTQVGQPNFLAPDYVVDATIEAARMPEYQRYCANAGLLELRQAVAERFTARGAQTSVEQVRAHGLFVYLFICVGYNHLLLFARRGCFFYFIERVRAN
jgi:hypothetical protein